MFLKLKLISVFLTFYFFLNIFLLPHYGVSWDEFIHYQRGQVYLQYFLTGNGNSFNENTNRLSTYQSFLFGEKWLDFSYWLENDAGHPPLNGILASAFNRLFYHGLGILDDIEGYHLFIVTASVFLTGFVFFWTRKNYGTFAGIIAFLSLALWPLFFGESHFNIKDPVEASFYGATLFFFYNGITKNNWKLIIISSVFAGLALGTKFNILFAFLSVVPWIVIYKWNVLKHLKWPFSSSLSKALLVYLFIFFGILYATWPFLWQNPMNNLLKTFSYYKEIGVTISYQPAEYLLFGKINIFAMQWILYTTPIVILFLSLIGIFYSLTKGFKEKHKTSLFILFWFLVPIIRVSMPNTGIYGGVRQIMEYIPAMAILAGIGAKYIVTLLHCYIVKFKKHFNNRAIEQLNNRTIKFTMQLLVVLAFLPITLKLISIHPNENVYFNPLIGGLKGAKERNLMYWGNTFGNVYRQGVEWLNKNVERDSKVALGVSYETSIPKIWIRPDIKYTNAFRSGMQKKGEYILELTHDMPVWSHYYYYNYAKNMLKPLYEVKVDDVPILTIWKNDWENTKEEYKKLEESLSIANIQKGENYILIDLEKEVLLTEINIIFSDPQCFFTKEGYFATADSRGNWINQPGDLGEVAAFYDAFDPRKNKESLSYIFPGDRTQLITVIYSESNNCFEDLKSVNIKRIP